MAVGPYVVLGRDGVQTCRSISTFRGNIMYPSSGLKPRKLATFDKFGWSSFSNPHENNLHHRHIISLLLNTFNKLLKKNY
jgi:hypothetical protein